MRGVGGGSVLPLRYSLTYPSGLCGVSGGKWKEGRRGDEMA